MSFESCRRNLKEALIKIMSEGSRKVTFFGWAQKGFYGTYLSFSHACDKTKKLFSIYLPSSKLTISLFSLYKHYAFDIADPSSMQDAYHMNFVIDLAHRSFCGSVDRASERGIRRSDVRFLMGTQNFSFVPRS